MRLTLSFISVLAIFVLGLAALGSGGTEVAAGGRITPNGTCLFDDGDDPPAEEPNDNGDWEEGDGEEEENPILIDTSTPFTGGDFGGDDSEGGDWEDPDSGIEADDNCEGAVGGETFTASPTPTFSFIDEGSDEPGEVVVTVSALDTDCSGEVSPADGLLALAYLAGLDAGSGDGCAGVGESGEGGVHGDANGNGSVDAGDVVAILAAS